MPSADEATQKLIIDQKLSDAEAKPVLANEGKNGQTRAQTDQILRATAQTKELAAQDATPTKTFGPKNEAAFQSWKKLHPELTGSDEQLREQFKSKK